MGNLQITANFVVTCHNKTTESSRRVFISRTVTMNDYVNGMFPLSRFQEPDAVGLEYLAKKFPAALTKKLRGLSDENFTAMESTSDLIQEINPGDVPKLITSIVESVTTGFIAPAMVPVIMDAMSKKITFTKTDFNDYVSAMEVLEDGSLQFIKIDISYHLHGCTWSCGCTSVHWTAKYCKLHCGSLDDLLAILDERTCDSPMIQGMIDDALAECRKGFKEKMETEYPEISALISQGYKVTDVSVRWEYQRCVIS